MAAMVMPVVTMVAGVLVRMMHVDIVDPMLAINLVNRHTIRRIVVYLVHRGYFTHVGRFAQPSRINFKSAQVRVPVLPVGSLTLPRRDFIDAFRGGCQHRTSFLFRQRDGRNGFAHRGVRRET